MQETCWKTLCYHPYPRFEHMIQFPSPWQGSILQKHFMFVRIVKKTKCTYIPVYLCHKPCNSPGTCDWLNSRELSFGPYKPHISAKICCVSQCIYLFSSGRWTIIVTYSKSEHLTEVLGRQMWLASPWNLLETPKFLTNIFTLCQSFSAACSHCRLLPLTVSPLEPSGGRTALASFLLELLTTFEETCNGTNFAMEWLVLPCAVLILVAHTNSLCQFFNDCQLPGDPRTVIMYQDNITCLDSLMIDSSYPMMLSE